MTLEAEEPAEDGTVQILGRLDVISQQLYGLTWGQRALGDQMRKLQQDFTSSGVSGRSSHGYTTTCRDPVASIGTERQRRDRDTSPPTRSQTVSWMPAQPLQTPKPLLPEPPMPSSPRELEPPPNGQLVPPPAPKSLIRATSGESGVSESARSRASMSVSEPEALGFWMRTELNNLKLNKLQRLSMSAPTMMPSDTKVFSVKGKWLQPLHPDSWRRALFDLVSISVLLYDSVLIPYQFAWEIEFRGWMAIISWTTWSFWCVDFLLGFTTGFRKREKVIMDFPAIARHYLMTYLIPNLVVLIIELATNVIESVETSHKTDYSRYIKLSRFIKLNRVIRLTDVLRTGKVAQLTDFVVNLMRRVGMAKQFNFGTRVGKLVFLLLWVNHVGGCLWHAVGDVATGRWLSEHGGSDGRGFEYMLGYYWSASSMIAGESVMAPTNTGEIFMTVICILMGFIFSSVVISSLLTTVMEYQESNSERSNKLKTLRQFLYQHTVDPAISVSIQDQVSERMLTTTRLSEKDVGALQLLSPMMRSELWYSIYGPRIRDHSFLHVCDLMHEGFIKGICYEALQHEAHEPGERIFAPNTEAVGAHYVYWGKLEFIPIPYGGPAGSSRSLGSKVPAVGKDELESAPSVMTPVDVKSWICVNALWVHWLHRGWLECTTACELLTVQADPFIHLVAGHPEICKIAQDYSSAIFEALKREPRSELSDIATSVDHYTVLSAMKLETRTQLSWAALKLLHHKVQWSGKLFPPDGAKELEEEVEAGDCDLVLEPEEKIYRLVTIAALKLERPDGRILTQIGKCIRGQTVMSVTLPGTKLHVGELPGDAVRRLLNNKLRPFSGDVCLTSKLVDTQEKISKKFGVPSRYMRTLFNARAGDQSPVGSIEVLSRKEVPPPIVPARNGEMGSATFVGGVLSNTFTNLASTTVDFASTYEAFVFRHEFEAASTCFIYAWLPESEFDQLTCPGGDGPVQRWVDALNMEEVEAATQSAAAIANGMKQSTISVN